MTKPWEEEANILKSFRKYDVEGTGYVNVSDLIHILEKIGVPATQTELILQAMTLKSQEDEIKLVKYDEFVSFVFDNMGLEAVFFDFDETLTTPKYIAHAKEYALSDRAGLCNSLSKDEILANFGGRPRVSRLATMLQWLKDTGVAIFIVSLGWTNVILRHLEMVGLNNFFHPSQVHGKDSPAFVDAGHSKAKLITRLRDEKGFASERCLFVDDNEENIKCVKHKGICRTLHVAGDGLCEDEMLEIESLIPGNELTRANKPSKNFYETHKCE